MLLLQQHREEGQEGWKIGGAHGVAWCMSERSEMRKAARPAAAGRERNRRSTGGGGAKRRRRRRMARAALTRIGERAREWLRARAGGDGPGHGAVKMPAGASSLGPARHQAEAKCISVQAGETAASVRRLKGHALGNEVSAYYKESRIGTVKSKGARHLGRR